MRSSAARREVPEDEVPPDLAAFQRSCEAAGLRVRLPRSRRGWREPARLPVDADEASALVARLRSLGL